jgi:cytochrome c-type biogenesis protein CcmH/NrfF
MRAVAAGSNLMLWIAVLVSVLLALGLASFVRSRLRRPVSLQEVQPMRATLERRLREGREFHL